MNILLQAFCPMIGPVIDPVIGPVIDPIIGPVIGPLIGPIIGPLVHNALLSSAFRFNFPTHYLFSRFIPYVRIS